MAKILHKFTNTNLATRQATAYESTTPGGELITANGTADNNRSYSFYATRAAIPATGQTGALFNMGTHGAESAVPIPEGLFVVANTGSDCGIDTTPYGTNNITP